MCWQQPQGEEERKECQTQLDAGLLFNSPPAPSSPHPLHILLKLYNVCAVRVEMKRLGMVTPPGAPNLRKASSASSNDEEQAHKRLRLTPTPPPPPPPPAFQQQQQQQSIVIPPVPVFQFLPITTTTTEASQWQQPLTKQPLQPVPPPQPLPQLLPATNPTNWTVADVCACKMHYLTSPNRLSKR